MVKGMVKGTGLFIAVMDEKGSWHRIAFGGFYYGYGSSYEMKSTNSKPHLTSVSTAEH